MLNIFSLSFKSKFSKRDISLIMMHRRNLV